MFSLFFHHKNFMIAILILISLSILCQIAMGVIYHRLIRETENMSVTSNRSLQQLKLKFSGCSKLNEGVSNVPIFVDKFLNTLKVGPFPISFMKHFSGQLMLLAVLVAGIGACRGIIAGESFFSVAPFYLISFLGLYCYFAVSSLADISGKAKILHTNLVDYLENYLANRIDRATLDMELIREEPRSVKEPRREPSAPRTSRPATPKPPKENSPAFSKSEAEELEVLLKEFLT